MKNKDKLILGVIVVVVIVGVAGGSIFFQPSGSTTLNISNQSTDQGTVGQGSESQGTGHQNKVNSNKNSTNTGNTNTGSTNNGSTNPGSGTSKKSAWKQCGTCGGDGKIGAYMCPSCGYLYQSNVGYCQICLTKGRYVNVIFYDNIYPCSKCGETGTVPA